MTDHQKKDPKFAEFHGIDRNRINWNPFVDESNCIGCGMCATTCGRGVYKFDYKKRKTVVAQPTNCLVACQTCFNLCPAKAISFAEDDKTREKAQKIVKDFHLMQTVKQELENKKQDLEI
ncbi:MAG: 4Fe-4S dicluster domain-containing protein [Desulfotignum sp.]|nr:4Fe-4S dicluster domain-containing protein [Desulfotignum sp.]